MNSFCGNIVIICLYFSKCQIKKVLKYKDFIENDANEMERGGGILDVRDRHSHSVSDIEPA